MFHVKHLFYLMLLQLISPTPPINLYFTDSVSESESNDALQHDCLRVNDLNGFWFWKTKYQVISYCMSESSLIFNIEKNDLLPSFTFDELSKQNVSSQQLLLWSAPIDVIERYQFYLNQLSTSNQLSLATEVFYNCTLPRFGHMCQYELVYLKYNDSPFYHENGVFWLTTEYEPTNLTCYIHLQCDRGVGLGCLDCSEICDGHINCLNGGVDEEHCWELEINDCKDNEYRCKNGQCIPWQFFQSQDGPPDCVDGTDEHRKYTSENLVGFPVRPIYYYEDTTCTYTFLSSSCLMHRHFLLVKTLLSIKEDHVSDDCWSAFICSLDMFEGYCTNLNEPEENIRIAEQMCPDIMKIPSVPVLFGDIYFVYIKNKLQNLSDKKYWDFYMCYNNSFYDDYFEYIVKVSFNSTRCYHYVTWMLDKNLRLEEQEFFGYHHRILHTYYLFDNYSSAICNRSNMYQCINSPKCISIYRLMDSVNDCPYSDDEHENRINNTDLQELFKRKTLKCPGRNKYVLLLRVGKPECYCRNILINMCDDDKFLSHVPVESISFQMTCNGFTDLQSEIIDERNETDETECEQWVCNNPYTRCDGVWHCINGADELGCELLSTLNCSSNDHICVSPHTNQLMCLSIERTNNGIIDCLGAIDEPKLCRRKNPDDHFNEFRCMNDISKPCIDSVNICDGHEDCVHGDDEQFCKTQELPGKWIDICREPDILNSLDVDQIICRSLEYRQNRRDRFFTLKEFINSNRDLTNNVKGAIQLISPIIKAFDDDKPRCHYGIDLRVWLSSENNVTRRTCLCSPSYYGDLCQYQNQRLSLIIQFSAPPNSHRTPFAVVISLIDDDDERIIHSYEQFTNFPTRDCYSKFRVYLVYSTRPKNETKRYSIHIDFYEKLSLGYRGSLLLPIPFPFLPVYRLALILHIPPSNASVTSCSNHQCIHGKCIRYFNNSEKATFCQCNRGWSGRYCTIPHTCMCSSDSLCIGVSAPNRSVCICPINRFGPRCLLIDTVCQTSEDSACPNGGLCMSNDEYSNAISKFSCICPKNFYGKQCQPANNKILLSFGKDIVVPQSILIHLIEVRPRWDPIVTTTFETIPINQDSLIIDWLQPFNIILTEFLKNNYYLTYVEKNYNESGIIVKMVNPSDRCRHITEVLNETIVKLPFVRRIKYYHLLPHIYLVFMIMLIFVYVIIIINNVWLIVSSLITI